MSEKNNVNPDHYKVKGRDRQGEDILQEVHKQQYAQAKSKGNSKETSFPVSPDKENNSNDDESDKTA